MRINFRTPTPGTNHPILPQFLHFYELFHNYIITKDGFLQKTFEIELPTNNSSDGESKKISNSFERWLSSLPNGLSITYEISHYLPTKDQHIDCSATMHGAAAVFERMRAEDFNRTKSFENKAFITFVYKPMVEKDFEVSELSIEKFNSLLNQFVVDLSAIGIKLYPLTDSETLTYLHSCISTKITDVDVPNAGLNFDLDYILSDCDVTTDTSPIRLGDEYIKVLSIRDFKWDETSTAMLDKICRSTLRVRWVSKYISMDAEHSMKFVRTKHSMFKNRQYDFAALTEKMLWQKEDVLEDVQAMNDAEKCQILENILAETGMTVGTYACFIILQSPSESELEEEAKELIKTLNGVVIVDETLGIFPSWIGSLPGNPFMGYRKLAITSQNFADLLHLSIPFLGYEKNIHMGNLTGCSAPLLYGRSASDRSLCFFSPNGSFGDVGHTAVYGKTGSGKSIFISACAASFLKYPNSRVILFDKDASALTNFAINQGGKIYRPLIDETVFQPLQDSYKNVNRCMKFIEAVCSVQGVNINAADRDELTKELRLLPPKHATLSVFASQLKGRHHSSEIVKALESYTLSGTGALFDAERDTFSPENFGDVTLIETTALMSNGDVFIIPALAYIFSQLERLFSDKRPTMLVLDEAWEYLKHPYFAATIQGWLRTLRKLNVFVILATQEISAVPNDILKTITASTYTNVFLPTPAATSSTLRTTYESLGVTDEELFFIERLKARQYYLIKQDNKSFMCVDFCFSEEQMKLFTSQSFPKEVL